MRAADSAHILLDLAVITLTILSLQIVKLPIVSIVIINAMVMNIIIPINAAACSYNLSYYVRQLTVHFAVQGLFELVYRSKGVWHYHVRSHLKKFEASDAF
jgi:hypothetical protein